MTEANRISDQRYYVIEKSKQELINMRDSDYDTMRKKNGELRNELKALHKYFQQKVAECDELHNTNKYAFYLTYSDWEQKYSQLQESLKEKDEELQVSHSEIHDLKRKLKECHLETKRLKSTNIELTHNLETTLSQSPTVNSKVHFTLFTKIPTLVPGATKYSDKIGLVVCEYFELKDFKKLAGVSKAMREFVSGNKGVLVRINELCGSTNRRYKRKILQMREKIDKLEEEARRERKVLYLDYDEKKQEIKEYLADFMVDDYVPGKKLRDSLDKACNMIVSYSRSCGLEDPAEQVKKAQRKNNQGEANAGAMNILRQSIASIGHSFGADDGQKLEPPKKEKLTSSFAVEKDEKTPHRSNGIFDTLFRPLEIKPEEKKHTKPPSGKNANMFGIVKDTTNMELENGDEFFDKNLDLGDRIRSGTIASPAPIQIQVQPDLTSFEIISFFQDKPKDLGKLLHDIGVKTQNSKDGKGGRWIGDILKNFLNLLIKTTYVIEEMHKLNSIKDYFALKIEKVIDEK